jgi:hypothetical protein
MAVFRVLSLLLVGAITFAGQDLYPTPQRSSAKLSDLCTVEGVVVKSTTGEGIKGATVQLSPTGPGKQFYSVLTDKMGSFTIRDIPPGRYIINAEGAGYTELPSGKGRGNIRTLDLTPGKNLKSLSFRLLPPGVITGTVYDEDGDPVTLAQVKVLRIAGSSTRRQLSEAGSAQTNDLGEYRIWGLAPGHYLVYATYQPQAPDPGQQAADDVVLPTFHLSAQDASQAMVVEVQPGTESSGIDVGLGQAHAVAVRGRIVTDTPSKSLRGVNVTLTPRAAYQGGYSLQSYGASAHDDSGDFEILHVPPGAYILSANGSEDNRQLYASAPLEVGSVNLESVTLVLTGPLELAGRIRVEGSGQLDLTRLDPWLQPVGNPAGAGSGKVKPDGTFVIPDVSDGTYMVRLFGSPAGYYLKSVRLGGSDVLESGLTISHSQPPDQLEIVLSPDGGRVTGTVLKGQAPRSGAWVVLVPDPPYRDRTELYAISMTDGFGRFSMRDLFPGGYELFAWEPVQGTNYGDPDVYNDFEQRATPVEIQERREQSVQLEVITTEEQLR